MKGDHAMSTAKKYIKGQTTCKVKFTLNKEAGNSKQTAFLVGDFNDWDEKATPMKKMKDGSFTVTLSLKKGNKYQYRYLLDGGIWENDWKADEYVPSQFGGSTNSVVVV
jgi:1,4-alpha-glucan branching enzyme